MLSTPRLRLRPFSLADVPAIFTLSREESLRRWIPDQVYRDHAHAEEVIRVLAAHTDRGSDPRAHPYVLAVEHAEHGVIGHVGVSPARGSVEIGYAIEQRLHGHGFATEAVTSMCAWAVAEYALPEILGIVAADNVPSIRVLEKAGFARQAEEASRVIYRFTQRR